MENQGKQHNVGTVVTVSWLDSYDRHGGSGYTFSGQIISTKEKQKIHIFRNNAKSLIHAKLCKAKEDVL